MHTPLLCCLQGPLQPFQVSPQADMAGGRAAAEMAPQDPPKIRVVVRKRPINKKVQQAVTNKATALVLTAITAQA